MPTILNIAFCQDCFEISVTGDVSMLDYHYGAKGAEKRLKEIEGGLEQFKGILSFTGEEDEFSTRQCDCCKTYLAGKRHYMTETFI